MPTESDARATNRARLAELERAMAANSELRSLRDKLTNAKSRTALAQVREYAEGLASIYPAAAPEFRELAMLAAKREKKKRATTPISPKPPKPADVKLRKRYDEFCAAGGRSIDEFTEAEHLDPEEVTRAFDRLRKAQRKSTVKQVSVR